MVQSIACNVLHFVKTLSNSTLITSISLKKMCNRDSKHYCKTLYYHQDRSVTHQIVTHNHY